MQHLGSLQFPGFLQKRHGNRSNGAKVCTHRRVEGTIYRFDHKGIERNLDTILHRTQVVRLPQQMQLLLRQALRKILKAGSEEECALSFIEFAVMRHYHCVALLSLHKAYS